MNRTAARTLLASLLAVLALGAGLVTSSPAAAAETGWIRAGHLAPGTAKADVRLTPFGGGRTVMLRGVTFGEITDYARVPAGLYTLAVVPAGSDGSVTPMISRTVEVDADTAQTVVATGDTGDVQAEVVRDDLTPPPAGKAKVRLISAADGGAVDARVVDGPLLAQDVVTGGSTGYATVDAQTWSIEVTAGEQSSTSRVPVRSGSVYTLLVTDDADGRVTLRAVRDSSGASRTPQGGMDTGAGPATTQDGPLAPAVGVAAALALAAGGVLLASAVRTRAARGGGRR